eukprot:TRINITY_DN20583_c0_g1_i1.p1 TRINITY_DN20583_c0_g1~~TRINITY_DN20583_c0_g1_i1.p1  ORF type:complete len:466 (+),score=56.12 TRINITY_DN20583_c0_g1_i1:63-1460(+)
MAKQDSALEYLHDLKEGRIRPRSQQRCCLLDESTRLDESVASDSSEDESFQSEFASPNLDAGYVKSRSRRPSGKRKPEAQVQQQPQPTSWYHGVQQQRLQLVDLPPRPARSPVPVAHCRPVQPSWMQPPQMLVATPVGPGGRPPPMAHASPVFWQHPAAAQVAVHQPSPQAAVRAAVVGQKPGVASGNVMLNLGASTHKTWPPQFDNTSDPLSRSVRSISTYGGSGSSNTSQLESFAPSMLSSSQQGLPWSLPATPMSVARTLGSSCSTPASIACAVSRGSMSQKNNNFCEARSDEQGHVGPQSQARTDSYGPPLRPAAMQGSARASYDSYTPPLVRPASSDQQGPPLPRNASHSDIYAPMPTPRSQARSIPSPLKSNSYTPPLIPRSQSYSDSPRNGALSPPPPTPRGTPCFGGVLQATAVNCTHDASIARSLPLAHVVAKVGSAPNLLLKENTSPAHHPRATF